MSKTPVSTLQEYMAKKTYGLPEYDLISQMNRTHLPSFTYRVKCGKQIAQGTATCKKEAKHNAAREMLKLLSLCKDNTPRSSITLPLSLPKTVPVHSYYAPGSTEISHDDIFVNSVGKLNEHCASHQLKTPEYTLSNCSGPDHMRMFTIKCSIGSLSAEGTANTKKQAKHEAAQKCYQLLIKTTTSRNNFNLLNTTPKNNIDETDLKMKNIQILNLRMLEPTIPLAKSRERAKELFPKLRNRDSFKIVKDIGIKDYHESLKNYVASENRETVQKQIGSSSNVTKEMVLNRVLELLNLQSQFETAVKVYGECVVSCTLNSTPVITDVGIGKTIQEARERAIENLLNSIKLLLK